jgi:hypothetical protein
VVVTFSLPFSSCKATASSTPEVVECRTFYFLARPVYQKFSIPCGTDQKHADNGLETTAHVSSPHTTASCTGNCGYQRSPHCTSALTRWPISSRGPTPPAWPAPGSQRTTHPVASMLLLLLPGPSLKGLAVKQAPCSPGRSAPQGAAAPLMCSSPGTPMGTGRSRGSSTNVLMGPRVLPMMRPVWGGVEGVGACTADDGGAATSQLVMPAVSKRHVEGRAFSYTTQGDKQQPSMRLLVPQTRMHLLLHGQGCSCR